MLKLGGTQVCVCVGGGEGGGGGGEGEIPVCSVLPPLCIQCWISHSDLQLEVYQTHTCQEVIK